MRKLLFVLLLTGSLSAQKALTRIHIATIDEIRELQEIGIDDILRVDLKRGVLTAIVETNLLSSINKEYEVLDPDLTYTWQKMKAEGLLIDFGPYYTYDEATQELDNIHSAHPDITTEKISIGVSWENRDVWAIKISDNPDISEGEPAVLFVALHHAREPIGCSILLDLARRLTEDYGIDPDITWLVNNREIWLIPIVNPDGYVYNEENSHGLWRKNKRDNNENGIFEESYDGVDLNRNYSYMWGYDDYGSSPEPSSEIYRGPYPFSDPETEAIKNICLQVQPGIVIDYHSYSNLLLFPWSYDTYYTPDDTVFRAMAEFMVERNGYPYGTVWEVLYTANGTSIDWHYGDTTRQKALGFTPEVGEYFWQLDTTTILEQIYENLPLNLFAIKASGLYFEMDTLSFYDQEGNPSCDPGDTVTLYVTLRNLCPIEDGYEVKGKLMSNSLVTIIDSLANFEDAEPFPYGFSSNIEPFRFVVRDSVIPGVRVPFVLEISAISDEFSQPIEFYMWVVEPILVFNDDFESGLSNWIIEGNGYWALTTTTYHSPTHSITDSPSGYYGSNWFTYITLSQPVEVSDATYVILEFWHRYDFEEGYDYGMIQVSNDGNEWFTVLGFTGTQNTWQKESIELTDFVESDSLYIRFLIETDNWVGADGWYIDDISIFSDASLVNVEESVTFSVRNIKFNTASLILRNEGRRIILTLLRNSRIALSLYDVAGRKVEEIAMGKFEKGNHIFRIETKRGGVYFLRLETDREILTRKVVILR